MTGFDSQAQETPQTNDFVRDRSIMCTLKGAFKDLQHILGISTILDGDVWVPASNLSYHSQGLCCCLKFSLNIGAWFRDLKMTDYSINNFRVRGQHNDCPAPRTRLAFTIVISAAIRMNSQETFDNPEDKSSCLDKGVRSRKDTE